MRHAIFADLCAIVRQRYQRLAPLLCNYTDVHSLIEGALLQHIGTARDLVTAAKNGHAEAQYDLAMCFARGIGFARNSTQAARWYCGAAEQGHVLAQLALGNCYARGEGVLQDRAKAVRWYKLAAEQSNTEAQFNLGMCYLKGHGVAPSPPQGLRWLECAAGERDLNACYMLAVTLYWGEMGVPQDKASAKHWALVAARAGHGATIELIAQWLILEEYNRRNRLAWN